MKKLLTVILTVAMLCTAFSGLCLTANASGGITPRVVSDYWHTLALNSEGKVFAWGGNNYGQLGNGTTTDSTTPIEVSALPAGKTFVDVANGVNYSLVLTSLGEVYAWGWNNQGQLGNGTTTDTSTPTFVSALAGKTVTKIFAGNYTSAAITSDGKLYVWGILNSSNTPVEIGGALAGKTVTDFAATNFNAIALTSDNKAYSWGDNDCGQLGLGTTIPESNPTEITAVTNVVDIAVGDWHTILLTADGKVFTCGLNESGQLGNGTTDYMGDDHTRTPHPDLTEISFPAGVSVKEVSANSEKSAALGTNGKAYVWGYGAANTPTEKSGLSDIVSISQGHNLMSIDSSGAVFADAAQVTGVGGAGFFSLGRTIIENESRDATGNYQAGAVGSTVYSVDITWGSLEFTYTDGIAGAWNPGTLQYGTTGEGSWSCAANANKITVTNRSNTAVTAELSFAESLAGISGGFYSAGTGGTAIAGNELSLASAAPVAPATVGEAKTAAAYLQITAGSLSDGQSAVKLGTVTVVVN